MSSCVRYWLACLMLSAGWVHAETVQEITERIVFARGGLAKLQSIQTERLSGKIITGDEAGTFVMELKRPNKIRLEVDLGDKRVIKAFDGTNGWKISLPTQTRPERMAEGDTKEFADEADIDGPFVNSEVKGTKVEIVDKELLGPSLVWKLKVTLKSGGVAYYYVESTGYFVLLREQGEEGSNPGALLRQYYEDFQRVENVSFPFRVIAENDESGEEIRLNINKIELNVPEDDTRFTLSDASEK